MEVKVGGLIPNLIRALKEKHKKKNAPPEKPQSDIIVDEIDEQRAQPYEGYRFTVGYNDDRKEEQILQPTYSVVCEFFDKMSDGLLQFVILENSKSIGGCVFIQSAWDEDGIYIVEAQVRRRSDKGVLHSQYRIMTEDKGQVERLFGDYLQGVAPDISDWEYMDDFDFYE